MDTAQSISTDSERDSLLMHLLSRKIIPVLKKKCMDRPLNLINVQARAYSPFIEASIGIYEVAYGKEVVIYNKDAENAVNGILNHRFLDGSMITDAEKVRIRAKIRISTNAPASIDEAIERLSSIEPSVVVIVEGRYNDAESSSLYQDITKLEETAKQKNIHLYFVVGFSGDSPFSPQVSERILRETNIQSVLAVDLIDSKKAIIRFFDKTLLDLRTYEEYRGFFRTLYDLEIIEGIRCRASLNEDNKPEFINFELSDFPGGEAEEAGAIYAEPRWDSKDGYVPIGRIFFKSVYFMNAHLEYIFFLLDLYQLAEFKNRRKLSFKTRVPIEVRRGQYYSTLRVLAKRWHVSRNKVLTFFNNMKREGLIKTQNVTDGTLITLLNYETYGNGQDKHDTDNETVNVTQQKQD
ncbi:MAG: hypothetical protein WAX69_07380 [Victivallales bacterium]